MLRIMLATIFMLFISGCGSVMSEISSVSEPQNGDRARLRAIGTGYFVNQNVCGDRPDLARGIFVGVAGPRGFRGRSIDMPRDKELTGHWGEMYIRADQQIEVAVRLHGYNSVCNISAYFVPEKDKDYEAVSGNYASKCYLAVFDITNGQKVPVSLGRKSPCK